MYFLLASPGATAARRACSCHSHVPYIRSYALDVSVWAIERNRVSVMTAPKVSDFMTASPYLIGAEQPLARAHDIMRKNELRHLPVLHGGKLVGLVSRGDLHFVETMPDVNSEKVSVEEAMSRDVYGVDPDEPLLSVVREMTTRKLGSAVILDQGKVVGIFTVIDALRVLDKALEALQRGDVRLD